MCPTTRTTASDTNDATTEQAQSLDESPKRLRKPRPTDDPFLSKHC